MTDIPAHELPLIEPRALPGVRVLEFGDKRNPSGLYRTWYEARGCTYTCVDINGRNGALPLDVRKPFDMGTFDVVTNFGFAEHVSVQQPFWANAHHACKVGGYQVGTLPKPEHWRQHGWSYWHPTKAFFDEWSEANGYSIAVLCDCGPGDPVKRMWGYVMKKWADLPHMWHPSFGRLFWKNPHWDIPPNDAVHYGSA